MLDLGAGTGRLTRELARRFDDVVAVEPDERMRALHGDALAGTRGGDPLGGRERACGLRRRGVPLVRPAARSVSRARAAAAWRARDPVDALGGSRPLLPEGALALPGALAAFPAQRRPPWAAGSTDRPSSRYAKARGGRGVDPDELLKLYSTTSSLATIPADDAKRFSPRRAAARWAVPAAAEARAHLDEACLSSTFRSAAARAIDQPGQNPLPRRARHQEGPRRVLRRGRPDDRPASEEPSLHPQALPVRHPRIRPTSTSRRRRASRTRSRPGR